MERIGALMQKLQDLYQQQAPKTVIDIDLMLDYTRVIYADLLDWRTRALPVVINEPTLAEIADAMDRAHTEIATTTNMTAPSVELGENVQYFEESENEGRSSIRYTVPMPPSASPLPVPGADIRKSIGINDKYLFISELFGNDKEAYETVISEINSFDDANEAQRWLKAGIVQQFRWDENSDTVQSFYDLLMRFFSAR
ncbi:hypothetical protein ACTHGU_04035 [Chitinophagaceae bacterium MMS25-I14]